MMDRTKSSRKHPARGVHIVSGKPTIVFDSVCTLNRDPWLANEVVQSLLEDTWKESGGWAVGRYVLMPDHLHYFAMMMDTASEFDAWVRYWKNMLIRKCGRSDFCWQSGHWETRMRTKDNYRAKLEYMLLNPVRKNLIETPEAWPYQGEINEIIW